MSCYCLTHHCGAGGQTDCCNSSRCSSRQFPSTPYRQGEDKKYIIIPAGVMKMLQPLDEVVDHPLKITFNAVIQSG
jgi:hypothetical protein